jgi:predicted outer membrane protein
MQNLSRRQMIVAGAGVVPVVGWAGVTAAQYPVIEAVEVEALDPVIAARMLIVGRKQISVCEMALDRLRDEGAIRFAEDEIREQETNKKRLMRLGYEYRVAGDDVAGRPTRESSERIAPATFVLADIRVPAGTTQSLMLDHGIAEQCIATQKVEMDRLRGRDFDRRFAESQLDAHYGLFDQVTTFQLRASTDIKLLLGDARDIIERHLNRCKDLREQLT